MSDPATSTVHHGADYGLTFGGSALSICSAIVQFLSENHSLIASLGVMLGMLCAIIGSCIAIKNYFLNKRLVLAKIAALEKTQKLPMDHFDELSHY